jgi:large subunit ribosomal protein L21
MEAYAVVATGGKQYRVKPNDTLRVELLNAEPGQKIDLTSVLALSDGSSLTIGKPEIPGAKVTVTVLKNVRAEKVISFKIKRRKGFKKKKGHRQDLTMIKVESIH